MSTDHDRLSEQELAELTKAVNAGFPCHLVATPETFVRTIRKLLAHEAALKAELVTAKAELKELEATCMPGVTAQELYRELAATKAELGRDRQSMEVAARRLCALAGVPFPGKGAAPAKEIPILKGLPLCAHGMATCEVCCKKDGVADQTAAELGAAPPEAKGRKT